MISHPVPSRPWQVLAVELFELQGQDYLVTTDYYSNFFEVDKLVSRTSKEVIEKPQASYGKTWNSGQDRKRQRPSVQLTGI